MHGFYTFASKWRGRGHNMAAQGGYSLSKRSGEWAGDHRKHSANQMAATHIYRKKQTKKQQQYDSMKWHIRRDKSGCQPNGVSTITMSCEQQKKEGKKREWPRIVTIQKAIVRT